MYSPAATTAMTPEPRSDWATRKIANGTISTRLVSSTGECSRRRTEEMTQAAPSPTPRPTPTASAKSSGIDTGLTMLTIAAIEVFSATSAVASLRRLSPSRIVTTCRGSPTFPAMALTATASVGATTAAKAKAAASVTTGNSSHVANPTVTTVNATSPTDRSRMLSRRARMSTMELRIAAANSSGGRMP